ncbi:hypothetical protein GCM10018775_79420 [Streptomyces umbrinus]|nr:hypothetical protein GCM10018775_79420 [Streptomyces umbrinus]
MLPERLAGRSDLFGGEAARREVSCFRGSGRQWLRHFEVTVRRDTRGMPRGNLPGPTSQEAWADVLRSRPAALDLVGDVSGPLVSGTLPSGSRTLTSPRMLLAMGTLT